MRHSSKLTELPWISLLVLGFMALLCNAPSFAQQPPAPGITPAPGIPGATPGNTSVVESEPPNPPADALYKNPDLPMDVRIKDLMRWMTLEEKVSQVEMASPAIDRLNVPGFNWWSEGIHGVSRAGNATVFPQAIAMAATWNPALMFQMAQATADEARAKVDPTGQARYRGLTFWAPTINMARDPRWGRVEETYGEDPTLTARLAVQFVRGMQGDDPQYIKIVASPKHFAAYSQETGRTRFNAKVSQRWLHEYYLPAFKAAFVEAKAMSAMAAHNSINSVPNTANRWLLTDLLRGQWGFEGAVVTDWGAIRRLRDGHKIANTDDEAVAAAINAGVDVVCDPKSLQPNILEAIKSGLLKEEVLDQALFRVLNVRFRLGTFDPPERVRWTKIPPSVVGCKEHVELALRAARESMVLLKNEPVLPQWGMGPLLPMDPKTVGTVAVLGPYAQTAMFGAYSGTPANSPVTYLDGIKAQLPPTANVLTAAWRESARAMTTAAKADVVVLVLGLNSRIESEGHDRPTIAMSHPMLKEQQDFLEKIIKINPCTVVVLQGGSPLDVTWLQEHVPAIIMAWYSGEQGGTALADILFGKINPSGRLPLTFFQSNDDLPPLGNYDLAAGRTYMYFTKPVQYPFGYGLSYTRYEYRSPRLSADQIKADGQVEVTMSVANTGGMDGDEVVQLYIRPTQWPVTMPARRLVDFKRVTVPANQSVTVKLTLTGQAMAYWDEKTSRFVTPAGAYEWIIGRSATDIQHRGMIQVVE